MLIKKLRKSFYGGYNGGGTDDFNCKKILELLEAKAKAEEIVFDSKNEQSWKNNMPNFCNSFFSTSDYKSVPGERDCADICKIIDTKYKHGYKRGESSKYCNCLLRELTEEEKLAAEEEIRKKALREERIKKRLEKKKQETKKKPRIVLDNLATQLAEGAVTGRFRHRGIY